MMDDDKCVCASAAAQHSIRRIRMDLGNKSRADIMIVNGGAHDERQQKKCTAVD